MSLPEGVDLEAVVRCPLCAAEYALRESLPPALVPVGDTESPAEGVSAVEADLPATAVAAAATEEATPEGQELDSPEVSESAEAAVPAEDNAFLGILPATGEERPAESATPVSETPETDTSVAVPSERAEIPEDAGAGPAESSEVAEMSEDAGAAPAETGQPAPGAEEGGMFDFLNHSDEASADAGSEPGGESASAVGSGFPALDNSDDSANVAGERRPSGIAVRPRHRKEKSMAKEMIGAILGGVVGLSITYYGLNFLGGQQFDFLGIWLPGVSHTQRHWTGAKDGDEAELDAPDDASAMPDMYPPEPKPEGALMRPISRYLDRNYQYLVSDGRIRPDSNKPPVVVSINGEEFMTAPEGEIIETIDNVQIGGAKLKKGYRLKKHQQWWVELGETEPAPDPAAVAKVEPKIELEPVELPEVAPEPKEPALPEGYIGPKHRDAYSMAQLGEALKAAHTEFRTLKPDEDLSDSLYQSLCQVAERLTFVDVEPDADGLFDRQLTIETMLESLGLRAGRVDQIGLRAAARLDDLDTADGGIVLAGTTGREVVRDGLHGTMLALPGTETVYNVLSDKPLGVEEGDTVLIAGVAVTNPSENLIGYPGSRPVVIWAALAVGLPKPVDAPAEPPEEMPAEDEPADPAPAEEEPTEEMPADPAPVEEEPTEEMPADPAPAEEEPTEEMPADPAPAEEEPTEEMPADPAPAEEEPAEETPSEQAPADEMPTGPTPAEEDPAKEPAVEQTPVEEAPADATPDEEAPADEAPAEESPVEPMPDDVVPAEDEPSEEAPAQ